MDRRDRDGEEIEIEIEAEETDGSSFDSGRDPAGVSGGDLAGGPDSDLADELGRIAIRSTPEGYVEGRVTGLETVDETTVRLDVRLPHGRTVTFALEKPIPWSEEFILARLVEYLGYDAASIDHVVGETVYVTRADLEGDESGWDGFWNPIRAASAFLETSLDRFGEREVGPQWRLVDPRELPDPDEGTDSDGAVATAAMAAVALGTVAAAAGAVVGATGTLAVSTATAVYAVPGLVLLFVGLLVLRERFVEPN